MGDFDHDEVVRALGAWPERSDLLVQLKWLAGRPRCLLYVNPRDVAWLNQERGFQAVDAFLSLLIQGLADAVDPHPVFRDGDAAYALLPARSGLQLSALRKTLLTLAKQIAAAVLGDPDGDGSWAKTFDGRPVMIDLAFGSSCGPTGLRLLIAAQVDHARSLGRDTSYWEWLAERSEL